MVSFKCPTGSSFTVSGSTLTFSSALTSSDSIDFILAMGEPLLVGTPSDGTVNTDKLASNIGTNAKLLVISASKLTTGTLPFDAFPAHTPIQMKTTAIATGSTATRIPFDNSVPTTSEGYVMTCTLNFTPTYNNSKILIECSFVYDKYNSNLVVLLVQYLEEQLVLVFKQLVTKKALFISIVLIHQTVHLNKHIDSKDWW